MAQRYAADFETTTDPDDCRVWAYGCAPVGDPSGFFHGTDLDAFMAWCREPGPKKIVYFHNLKFDGEFILYWLMKNGYRHTTEKKPPAGTFSTLISEMGQFYAISVVFKRTRTKVMKVDFYDSLKILPFSVKAIARGFGMQMSKGEIDYAAPRPVGHILTDEELDYLRRDVLIVAQALHELFSQDMTRMTAGSNALSNYRERLGKWEFKKRFPVTEFDFDIRQSYRGGFTWLNPQYANREIGPGIVLDVNSLYPSVMHDCPMPYGEPRAFEGAYKRNVLYPLFVQMFTCHFELKPDHVPTVQVKHSRSFVPTEYLTSSCGQDVTLCMTNIDLLLFFDHYNIYNITWHAGWMFKSKHGLFTEYVDHWTEQKTMAKETGNRAQYILAKLMMNSLYGKFASSPAGRSKEPFLRADGSVGYKTGPVEERTPVYIPVGTFITSYARDKTIRAAQKLYPRFVYADTDSLHLVGTGIPAELDVDPLRLGAWKHEMTFTRAKFLRAKTYLEYGSEPGRDELKWKVTCAGMPSACHKHVTIDNFKVGCRYPGKLVPWHVPGGIVLMETDFTIIDNNSPEDRQQRLDALLNH